MRLFSIACLWLAVMANAAAAAGYDEFYVKKMPVLAEKPAVAAVRLTAFQAARNADIEKLTAQFAEKVTIYSANADPQGMKEDRFQIDETVIANMVVKRIAAQVVLVSKVSEKQLLRSGFFAMSALLRDPHIGANGKMDGAICNRAVNKPDAEKLKAALAATKSRLADWVVARRDMGPDNVADAPGQYPTKIYKDQMVLQTKETHSDKRWTSIAALDGGESLFYQHPASFSIAPYFAKYVAEHVCFGKKNGRWKITTIALRRP